MMKANGLDPIMMDEMSTGDPSQSITLYKASSEKKHPEDLPGESRRILFDGQE
jgi:hypothetical protein